TELQEGKLILAPFFDLFDSMSALEIMDPKMDSGLLLCNKPDFPPLDCLETRTPEEVLWIIDQFTACEMTWQSGYSAAQTILMCPYLKFLIPLTP
ncbi:Mak10 subunit of NatC N-terminal acetyltransferase, partial [Dimargaris cristalligena]